MMLATERWRSTPTRRVLRHSVALHVMRAPRVDALGIPAEERVPIPGLQVFTRLERALYHEGPGLYGFVSLLDGTHKVEILDPLKRYLPRSVSVTVTHKRDDEAKLERKELVSRPIDPVELWLYPRPGGRAHAASTRVTGRVLDSTGVPQPLARVMLEAPDQQRVITYADAEGMFALVSPGERVSLGNVPVDVFDRRVFVDQVRRQAPPSAPWYRALPDGFDTFAREDAARQAAYRPIDLNGQSVSVRVGMRVHVDLQIP